MQVGGLGERELVSAASSPSLAVDPRNPDRMVVAGRVEEPEFGCNAYASADAGATWTRSRLELPRLGERCYAPTVAFGADGRVHLLLSMLAGPGNDPVGAVLLRSVDGGATFGRPRVLLGRAAYQTSVVSGPEGRLAVAWLQGNEFASHAMLAMGPRPNPIHVRTSSDGGRSFGPPRSVGPRAAMLGGPVQAIGRDGTHYVAFWDYGTDVFDYHGFPGRYRGHFRLLLGVSRDGGRSFRTRVVESQAVPPRRFLVYLPPLPALAVDSESGDVYVAWEDGRSGTSDVLFRRSADGGATWSAASVLFGGPSHERVPALADSERDGLVAAAYRVGAGGSVDVAVRRSTDGGKTFSRAAALTPAPFDAIAAPRVPGVPEHFELGSRLGLTGSDEGTLAAWTDARTAVGGTGKMDLLVRRVPDGLAGAAALPAAAAAPPPAPSQADRRLRGACRQGPELDSRETPALLLRSFLSALERGELRRAYGYLHPSWRHGTAPAPAAHSFAAFRAEFGSVTCARLARVMVGGRGRGDWRTMPAWIAVRRSHGPTRLMVGTFWARGPGAQPPWSLMGYWSHELPRRLTRPPRSGISQDEAAVSRWITVTLDEIASHRLSPPRAARTLALVSAAAEDAVASAPGRERDTIAVASSSVLAHLFPDGAAELRAGAAGASPAARRAGEQVARRLIARARADGASARWLGRLPADPRLWRPLSPLARPVTPLAGTWKPWALRSGAEFRPGIPPLPGSPRFDRELREVYAASRNMTPAQRAIADRWADGAGTATPAGHWNRIALDLLRAHTFTTARTARLFALLNKAQADAFIACWDAKYAYWTPRPITEIRRELDPNWRSYLPTPSFPSFPSGHASTSAAAAEVLARFFPAEAERLRRSAEEAAASRLYGGIHYQADSDAGLALGRNVARAVLGRLG